MIMKGFHVKNFRHLGSVSVTPLIFAASFTAQAQSQVVQESNNDALVTRTDSASPTASNDPANILNEIVVTAARRRSESVQSTPIAVTALNAAQLERNQISGLADIGRLAPNLIIQRQLSTANQAAIYLRGFGNTSNDPAIDPPIAVYVDGIYQPLATGTQLDTFGVESIEVERGPQGTLLGKNASTGALSLNARRPTGEWGGAAEIGYERFDHKEAKIRADAPLITDILAINGSFIYKEGGDYIRGSQFDNKRRFGGEKVAAARIGILFTPTSNFDLLVQMNGENTRNSETGLRDYGYLPQNGPYQAPSYSCLTFGECAPTPRFVTNSGLVRRSKSNDRQISATATWKLAPVVITSVTGYKTVDDNAVSDVDGAVAPVIAQLVSAVKYHQFSQEVRISSRSGGGLDLDGHLDWVVGGFYSNFKYESPFILNVFGSNVSSFQEGRTKSYALFAHTVYNFSDKFNISLGMRQSWDDKTHSYRNTGETVTFIDDPLSFKNFSTEAGIQYKFTSRQMIYFRYAEGYRNGGYQGLPPANVQVPYRPETVKTYELGIKADFLDRRLRTNLALFQSDYKDLQRTTIASLPVSPFLGQYINNAANARVRGIELETTIVPVDALIISLSATYLQPKYKNFIASIVAGDPPQDLSAFPFPFSSKYTVKFAPQYVADLGSGGKVTLGSDLTYATSYYTIEIPYPLARVRALALLNASVKWADASDRYYVELYGHNLTNRYFIQQYTTLPTSPGGQSLFNVGVDATPVTWGVKIGAKF
jgi:iron complex outermembrane receptor protein